MSFPDLQIVYKDFFSFSSQKQMVLESKEENESNLTTLFPGQKRRISHISKQENVSEAMRNPTFSCTLLI